MTEKRKKIETKIYTTMSKMDKTGLNTEKYKRMFKEMSDEQFEKWIKAFLKDDEQNFYLEILPHKNEPKLTDLIEAANYLKIPLDEYIYYRHNGNKEDPIRSAHKVPVGYITIKRLQQMLYKKNSYSLDVDVRNQRTNQLTGDDKIARITDAENFSLGIYEADYALREFFGPRADNSVSKMEMNRDIATQGYTQLQNYTDDVKDKHTLNTIDVYFMGAGLMTDLVTPDLELIRTKDGKTRKQSTQEINDNRGR